MMAHIEDIDAGEQTHTFTIFHCLCQWQLTGLLAVALEEQRIEVAHKEQYFG